MKVPETWQLPLWEDGDNPARYYRRLVRRLRDSLEELSRAVNANTIRGEQAAGTGAGSIKMAGTGSSDNTGWIEIEEDKWIPYWTKPDP